MPDYAVDYKLTPKIIIVLNIKMHLQPQNSSLNILTRGVVELIYSSTTGTSRNTALKFEQLLQQNQYIAMTTNIGDFDPQNFIDYSGIIIFFLSTYGDGSSPHDGQNFLQWIQKLQPKQQFTHMQFCVLAFGNSSFDHHCKFGIDVARIFKAGGGNQLMQVTLCDAHSSQKNVTVKFPEWSKNLLQILNQKNSLKQVPRSCMGSAYTVTLEHRPNFNWSTSILDCKNIRKQFSSYLNMPKCKVLHIKQLRKQAEDDRSTLWIRIQIDQSIQLTPACNINIFPINSVPQQEEDDLIAIFSEIKGKLPFPPIPIKQIKKLLNLKSHANPRQLKKALLSSRASLQLTQSYTKRLKEQGQIQITLEQLLIDLKPGVQFLAEIGLNTIRPYSLASWNTDNNWVDICVSIVKNGLTCNYLKTNPEYIRISTAKSPFYIPQARPIVMIANGTGIAPFRSIVQYLQLLPPPQRVPIRLYFGIQNQNIDFYFAEQWIELQKKGVIQLRLAQSRKNTTKQYVQNLLQTDLNWLEDHLFNKNGVIFICGGSQMSKDVNKVIFKCLTAHVTVAYKAFTLFQTLKQSKTIVQQVFG